MGLGYCWSFDFVGSFVPTSCGPKYVLVMMEYFSTWIELIALPHNSTKLVDTTFIDYVLACLGAHANVLTNQGRNFLGAFVQLYTKTFIYLYTTSRDHLGM